MDNRLFYYGLTFSFIIHLIILVALSFSHPQIFKKPLKQIEVTYHALKSGTQIKKVQNYKTNKAKVVEENDIEKKVKILPKKHDPASQIGKDIKDVKKLKERFHLEKKQVPKFQSFDTGRKITVPMVKSEKITNIKYLNYYQNIRQIIKQRAYAYIDHPDFDTGEIYLSFILRSDGVLLDVKILDERTKASESLKNLGKRIIRELSPFPKFSKDLDYPELTFNVVISFKLQ